VILDSIIDFFEKLSDDIKAFLEITDSIAAFYSSMDALRRSQCLKLQWMEHKMIKACLPEVEETDDKRKALTSAYVDRTRGWVSSSPSCEGLPLFSVRDWYPQSSGLAGDLFPLESLSPSDPSGRSVVLALPSSEARSRGSTVPEETEWDYSEPSVGLGGITLVLVGGFFDLDFCLFLQSALEASGPYDLGKVGVTV
ncbi:hypothetical protein Tco_1072756, partial [Tanacetum coccineum]